MNLIAAFLAAMAVATMGLILGSYINYDMDFLCGWLSCLAFLTVRGQLSV